MTLRHDPLLAHALAREIGRRWRGRRVRGLHLAPEPRAAELRFEDAPSLLFLLHPEEGAVLAAAPALAGGGTAFRALFLGRAWAPADERALLLPLLDRAGRERHRVAVELHTNQWNLLLLDGGGEARVRAALWHRRTRHRALVPGASYELPPVTRAWAAEPPAWPAWREALGPVPPDQRRRFALREVSWLGTVSVDHVLGEATAEVGEPALRAAHARYLELRRAAGVDPLKAGDASPKADEATDPAAAWLLHRSWGEQPYPVSLHEPDARRLPGLLEAMEAAAGGSAALTRRLRELAAAGVPAGGGARAAAGPSAGPEEAIRLRRALLARRKRLRGRLAALERELDREPRPEELRAVGNLLLARLRDVPRGAGRVVLEDFDGSPREVELDPTLGPAQNAEAYFEEAARRERAASRVPEEIDATRGAIAALEDGLRSLDERDGGRTVTKTPARADTPEAAEASEAAEAEPSDVEGERLRALWRLAGGRPDEGGAAAEGERLPYLRYRSSGGLEIRVGRSSRTNDELTFHHSGPEDVWLHARQVQGAHVILRWGRKEENPPRRDLLEAAVAAAVHSRARHSGTVAVDWTRRKYVRKPRKAPPGAVLPDRVRTLFVEPDAALLERLAVET